MELDIIRLGAPVGRLSIRDAGLYRQISARIAPAGTLLRLYLDGEAFGVFCPEGDALTLRTRVSRDRLPAPPGLAVAWCPADGGWQPSSEGLIRFTPLGDEAAAAWHTDGPMIFPTAPGRLQAFRLGDGIYLRPINR